MNTYVAAAAAHLRVGPGQTNSVANIACPEMYVVGVRLVVMRGATAEEARTVIRCCRVRLTINGRGLLDVPARYLDPAAWLHGGLRVTPPDASLRLAKSDAVVVSVAYEPPPPPPPPTLGARILLRMPKWVRERFLAPETIKDVEDPEDVDDDDGDGPPALPLRRELVVGVVLDGYALVATAPTNGRTSS